MKQTKIIKCLAKALKKDISEFQFIDSKTPLSDLGLTSLSFISFIVELEEECNIEVLDSDLLFENFSTLQKLFQTLEKYFPGENAIKKVLILDADNVLWKGISGEEKIEIDADILNFQEYLLELYQNGVLLCLCSKNQTEIIEQSFSDENMRLKQENFAVFLANRNDKVSNIKQIAAELNLSVDSFVFADDSDYELGFVSLNFPEITCIKVDYQSTTFISGLKKLFESVHSTSKYNRTQLYREQKEREKEKHRYTSVQEYNQSLETKIRCERAQTEECARLAELSQRTHQFNLSAKQYTEAELEELISNPDYILLSLSVSDKYGDMGIVGMSVIHKNVIEAFMLSCRVFDRDLENVLLNKIKVLTSLPLYGIFHTNDKNHLFKNFYQNNGVIVI